ncbi:hypothetical protein Glove_267g43 [Diversispora epigaea]|uniref:Prolyl endopeptidase n=1 Tax=Diversispora epigaea TaxID=1348612 RepID=A0A397IAI2_9GLOM|nr:hypothetical protein Glove_267g43 [Diversispora epigaea]
MGIKNLNLVVALMVYIVGLTTWSVNRFRYFVSQETLVMILFQFNISLCWELGRNQGVGVEKRFGLGRYFYIAFALYRYPDGLGWGKRPGRNQGVGVEKRFGLGRYFYIAFALYRYPDGLGWGKRPGMGTLAMFRYYFWPNILEKDGTASLRSYSFSKKGNYFAYGISKSGGDWVTIYVKRTDLELGEKSQLNDVLEWNKYSNYTWTHDEAGFFYLKYPQPEKSGDKGTGNDVNKDSMIYYHKFGTPQSEDILAYKDPNDPYIMFDLTITIDGRYVIMSVRKDHKIMNKLWICDLEKTNYQIVENLDFIKIVDEFKAEYDYIVNEGTIFYFKTNSNAPRNKVVRYDLSHPEQGFIDFIKENSQDVLSHTVVVAETNLILIYMHDVHEMICIYDLSTGKHKTNLSIPIGTVDSIRGRKEDTEFFFKIVNYLNPGIIYKYDFIKESLTEYKRTIVKGLNSELFETKQVFIESKDKTRLPIFIIAPKNLKLDGNNPTLLYGYGGFNISLTPNFKPSWITFAQHYNAVIAVAITRGGGEYGEEWHKAGTLSNRQNVNDDFQSIAKWLIDNKYTRPEKLAINGGSNGGSLVCTCINQAPELFGVCVSDVGVLDMLRFHKFTTGYFWKSDYGDPDKKEDFEYIYKWSPLHNVQTKKPYPAVLLNTGDHDDRVSPLHSYKYIATLQHAVKNNPKPLLIRVYTNVGHGSGKPTQKIINETVDKFSFIALAIDAKWVE